MIIQLQFSEIMGCANLFQRFLTLAVYCVSPYTNYLLSISTTKRVLTGFSTKIKIKKNTERIKNISMFDITQYLTKIKCHQFIYLFKFKS
jgi:hypothetical protein